LHQHQLVLTVSSCQQRLSGLILVQLLLVVVTKALAALLLQLPGLHLLQQWEPAAGDRQPGTAGHHA